MRQFDNLDDEIHWSAMTKIGRRVGVGKLGNHTIAGELHPLLFGKLALLEDERVLVSAHISDFSWFAITTRRVVSLCNGVCEELDARHGLRSQFGNVLGNEGGAGRGSQPTGTGTLLSLACQKSLDLQYETGAPGLATLYAAYFWGDHCRYTYEAVSRRCEVESGKGD
jgi:hypothetical protein